MNTTDIKTGIDFENYVMQLFLLDGIRTLSTPASNDYGSDLIIKYNGIIFSAQCKFYSKPVSLKAVQEVMGSLKYYNANYGSDSLSKNTSTPISFSSRTMMSKSTVFLESLDMDFTRIKSTSLP